MKQPLVRSAMITIACLDEDCRITFDEKDGHQAQGDDKRAEPDPTIPSSVPIHPISLPTR